MVFPDGFKKISIIFLNLFIILLALPFDASATGKYLFDPPSETNLFPQPSDNSGFTKRDNGIINSNQSYSYKYDYGQKTTWTWHGFDLGVDPNVTYTWSFDAYISPDANLAATESTFIANGEVGFGGASFYYDNTRKGVWQHFEYTGKPTSNVARLLLYPTKESLPATTGYIEYRNVEFRKAGTAANLYPQPSDNEGFSVKGGGVFTAESYANSMYKYDYAQKTTWTWHGFDIKVDPNATYTWSLDAYISPDADIAVTGNTFIAQGEGGFPALFRYDNTNKGTWQHFEFTGKPASDVARILLYPTFGDLPATTGHILYKNVDFRKTDTVSNLFPQPTTNEGFTIRGGGVLTSKTYNTYSYDYAQNLPWTWHGFDIPVDSNATYTWSFDAYISSEANIAQTGTTAIAQGEGGFTVPIYYDNGNKGKWQHFEHTGKPTSSIARLLLYPTMANSPATTGFVLYRNVEFKKWELPSNLFPQPSDNSGFTKRDNGIINSNQYYSYKYDYGQKMTWTWHGFDLGVDPNVTYTWSFDAYISPDANLAATGSTFIANGEGGFGGASFYYDNTRKGVWQHFEYTGKPTSNVARLLLYPTKESLPATTGYIEYRNVEFRKAGTAANLYPQPLDNEGFSVKGGGLFTAESYANSMYKYDYAQKKPWTWHGFDIKVDPNATYTWSLDAYISPDADIAVTGNTFIAQGEGGFPALFRYDNTNKGTWQHFEFTGKPASDVARILLYPTFGDLPATTGHILYKNVDFRKTGTVSNLFPQPTTNEGFTIRGGGVLTSKTYNTYSYDYAQNLPWTWHGFDIPVDPNAIYTWSFDAYISSDANIAQTGTTAIAQGEGGFTVPIYYDNGNKGKWQHFEHTGKPTSSIARLLLYPTMANSPATTGFVLYRNVEFKVKGIEWNEYVDISAGLNYKYDTNGRLLEIQKNNSKVPITKIKYDSNGNVVGKEVILP